MEVREMVERYHQYIKLCEQSAEHFHGHDVNKHYDMVDLLSAQERAIRQLTEYLDGDEYLAILVDWTIQNRG